MSEVRFKLGEILEYLDVPGTKLAEESQIRRNTVYDMIDNRSKSVSLRNLAAILSALNRIAAEKKLDRRFEIKDILEFID
ncbi:cro/C1-type HTH DNA-binding domain protein (plasmid) [Anoxybacillus sp. B7M1]|uniref:helix-turn-helix domain-containing protein n=1 Tax=Anoxybacillus sp. B7M1 TaxID=1490057 RepID=UPI0005CCA97D|nr:helix-turn-helix domain-containing protein [Anoxybacillus sp. B7M1]ANB66145.1 cro/C1-type HTH DNA-binding domain protein [Anoxybacillus sp. B7M1]